jgi:hypothetical protein
VVERGDWDDYLEKTWQANYRGANRTYDYEGMVADGYPLLQHIPDVRSRRAVTSGRTWWRTDGACTTLPSTSARRSAPGRTIHFQRRTPWTRSWERCPGRSPCAQPFIQPGQELPAAWGGGKNLWAWPIPRLAKNVATKPELVGHFAEESPDFNLRVPDQIRVNVFLRHLKQWEKDRAAGNDTMPNFIELRLPNDHTAGTTPGGPTPKSLVADNDLAIGRAVEAISHSAYWDDTAFFILEDDAQNGADHVDAHRSLGIVVSKYAPHPKPGEAAVVDSRFYSTVSVCGRWRRCWACRR